MTPDADPPGSPLACAVFFVVAFTLAGLAQLSGSDWLASPLRVPLDGRRTFRGRRVLGDNKTWGGLVVMVPAVGMPSWSSASCAPWPLAGSGLGAPAGRSGCLAVRGVWLHGRGAAQLVLQARLATGIAPGMASEAARPRLPASSSIGSTR